MKHFPRHKVYLISASLYLALAAILSQMLTNPRAAIIVFGGLAVLYFGLAVYLLIKSKRESGSEQEKERDRQREH
ncbi:hypothetical protein [Shouchella patagoniensis]|uniref:hypothetical protein n=1 Tax=Shouchella patagoniensis TaxID=228576 RepID=UPI000994E975|nr:hypothetical protein [Shouchella patagoniensis]